MTHNLRAALRISEKTVARLALYRRLLREHAAKGAERVFSHELATLAKVTAAQVRRDLMSVGYEGSPIRGYSIEHLIHALGHLLDSPVPQKVALVGVGNLGRALLAYFVGRQTQYNVCAAFDADPEKAGHAVNGCPVYATEQLADVVRHMGIAVAIVAVPATVAQATVTDLCRAGVTGILNFAPVRVWVPEGVYIEYLDMSMSLERVAFFAQERQRDMGENYVNRKAEGA